MAKTEAIAALMLSSPSSWLARNADGQRLLDTLHAQLALAGLTPAIVGGDDVTMLHAMCAVRSLHKTSRPKL